MITEWPKIMSDFKHRHPGKLSLIHINGEARTITRKEFHEKYFPGHWIYRPAAATPALPVGRARTQGGAGRIWSPVPLSKPIPAP